MVLRLTQGVLRVLKPLLGNAYPRLRLEQRLLRSKDRNGLW